MITDKNRIFIPYVVKINVIGYIRVSVENWYFINN